ncbi:hypothetical protein CFE70_002539 [Pyrenophora teres f. teres 0-1]|uniref:Uncharacterized protein n=2 Tax=Pyrenophora teres f. teres TaxID=97479 RepID=E3RJR6_PYRTT|nr:hypothetical protein PTT_08427 [Pyrenophora teres f. teres 0-1]KAE8843097.1 hypothetical protein HRS9139_02394 [Pyrenophora teres f. teres]CAA9959020.1 hypothetical protein PTMSG1_02548 [Pyrenophora teres f. maculata]KAE8849846.1 hypothetical protein PTNB85_00262 [Pyrenophora teres f. teres]KAE8852128.1 hypothetical protein HRS9122_02415 [Pyrenophora teres f. teres]
MDLYTSNDHPSGSREAKVALAALAHDLDINHTALKTVLEGALDILPSANHNSFLAFQWSFERLGYHIEVTKLFAIVIAFRQNFGIMLGGRLGVGKYVRKKNKA